jgi:hypothetical protein
MSLGGTVMKLKNTLLAATHITALLSSQAQPANPLPVTRVYISLGAGSNSDGRASG